MRRADYDRLPSIFGNEGNSENVMVSDHAPQHARVIAIDSMASRAHTCTDLALISH